MTVNTMTIGPGTLTIGTDDDLTIFSHQCTSATLSPSVDIGDALNVLSGETVPGDRTETFVLKGTLAQDFGVTEGTTEWLWVHRGEIHDFVYAPSTAGGREITGQLTVEAIDIGGDVKTKGTSDFEFTLTDAPVFAAIA